MYVWRNEKVIKLYTYFVCQLQNHEHTETYARTFFIALSEIKNVVSKAFYNTESDIKVIWIKIFIDS